MSLCDQHFLIDACYSPIGDSDSALVILRELLEQVGEEGIDPREQGLRMEPIQVGLLDYIFLMIAC